MKIALSIFSIALSLGLVEVGLRAIHYGDDFPDATPPSYDRVHDPYRGFFLKPNQRLSWKSPCFDITGIEINRFGMRDRERTRASAGPRVALLGDSFLRAFEVANKNVINILLEAEFPGVEFLNFGEAGYGTVQSYQTYIRAASEFRPDAIVYFIYPNDLIDNHYMLRAWREGNPGPMSPGSDPYPNLVRSIDGSWAFVGPSDYLASDLASAKDWLAYSFKSYLLVRHTRDAIKDRQATGRLVAAGAAEFPAAENVPYPREWMLLSAYSPPKNRYWFEAWEVTREAIGRLSEAARMNTTEFFVVGVPEKEILRIDAEGFEKVVGRRSPEDFDPQYFYRTLGEFLSEKGIPFLNLQEAYYRLSMAGVEQSRASPVSLYHDCNVHWNEAGHRVTARIVADFIRQHFDVWTGQRRDKRS